MLTPYRRVSAGCKRARVSRAEPARAESPGIITRESSKRITAIANHKTASATKAPISRAQQCADRTAISAAARRIRHQRPRPAPRAPSIASYVTGAPPCAREANPAGPITPPRLRTPNRANPARPNRPPRRARLGRPRGPFAPKKLHAQIPFEYPHIIPHPPRAVSTARPHTPRPAACRA